MTAFLIALALGAFALGVALNALFAGYETGFLSADPIRMRFLAEEEKNARAKYLARHLKNKRHLLTTVLIGTNIALIFGTTAIALQVGPVWATIIATPIFLIFAEIVPKTIFRRHPTRLVLAFLPVIRFFDILMAPLVWPTLLCSTLLLKLMGSPRADTGHLMTSEEDFRNLVEESAARGTIEEDEQRMIHSVMDLQDKQAKEIMVPRIDIQALPDTASRDELLQLLEKSGRTRILIYTNSIDTIVGVANAYDVLLDTKQDDQDIKRFIREVIHVPDTMPVGNLLQELKKVNQHMAVVTDEYGGTDGLITLEDTLEEIFGEIHDEHDPPEDFIQQIGPQSYRVDARMPLEDFAKHIGLPVDEGDAETVGGWVIAAAGAIPHQGEKLTFDGFRVTVLEGRPNFLSKIRLDILPGAGQLPGGEKSNHS